MRPHTNGNSQTTQFKTPAVVIPAVKINQPNGSVLFRAGKPIVMADVVTAFEAATILSLSKHHIENQCSEGLFKTASKPVASRAPNGGFTRTEVIARLQLSESL